MGSQSKGAVSMKHRGLPDFLIIGAQRSGTSWLYRNLGFHPHIWLPPIKELHYFDADTARRSKLQRRYRRHLRRRLIQTGRHALAINKHLFPNLLWDFHFFLGKRSNECYVKLFRPEAGQVAGEATPAYSVLDLVKIREIHQINPKLNIIYILRDPIERSWSAVTKILSKKKQTTAQVATSQILQMLSIDSMATRNNYLQVLENWQSIFPEEQIFTGFFEEIASNPEDLLLRIYAFLGVAALPEYVSPTARVKVNAAGQYQTAIPRELQVHLAGQQIEQLRELSKRFGGPANDWLERAEKTLEDAGK